MAKTLGRTHAEYAKYFNLTQKSCGHVWQARYFSCPLEASYLWRAMAYVERNPVRAGLVEDAGAYRWSSVRSHLGESDPGGIVDVSAWRKEYTPQRWIEVLRSGVDDEQLGERIREATLRGRPMGGDEFIERLEAQTGRRLRPRPTRKRGKRDSTPNHQTQPSLFSLAKNGD